jgi:hypothetical protein
MVGKKTLLSRAKRSAGKQLKLGYLMHFKSLPKIAADGLLLCLHFQSMEKKNVACGCSHKHKHTHTHTDANTRTHARTMNTKNIEHRQMQDAFKTNKLLSWRTH